MAEVPTENNHEEELLSNALRYTDGDMQKAKDMIAGVYTDISVIKLLFRASNVGKYGLVVIFINTEKNYLQKFYSVVSKNEQICNEKPYNEWQHFFSTILETTYSELNEIVSTSQLGSAMEKELSPAIVSVLSDKINSNDTVSLNLQFEKMISFIFKTDQIELDIKIEKAGSIFVEEGIFTVEQEIKTAIEGEPEIKEDKKSVVTKSPVDTTVQEKDKEFIDMGNTLVPARLVLSPVKGKWINQLLLGEEVKVKLSDKSPRAVAIADKLGCRVDGKMKSISGSVESITKTPRGWLIYITLAPNLVAKILEEEDVKVALADKSSSKKSSSGGKNAIVWILIIFLILVMVAVYFAFLSGN